MTVYSFANELGDPGLVEMIFFKAVCWKAHRPLFELGDQSRVRLPARNFGGYFDSIERERERESK